MNHIVILAGGSGTRLWPVSRKSNPKQTECFFGKKTLLQSTYERVLSGFPKENIFISCGSSQKKLLKGQIKNVLESNFILEPEAKGTAMAIGLACIKIYHQDKGAVLIMANADHFIAEDKKYIEILKKASKLLINDPEYLSLVGIKPKYPETGYGYIEVDEKIDSNIYKVKKFKEKPNLKLAQKYFSSDNFLWNPAWFVFRADTMLDLFKKYLPKHYQALKRIEQKIGTVDYKKVLIREFKKIDSISIDYGIMEKAKKMFVLKADLNWHDIGSWRAVKDCFAKSQNSNLEEGNAMVIDSKDSLIVNKDKEKLVSVVGVDGLVVINTKDSLFICPKEKSQEVKKIINKLKENKKYNKYL